MDESGSASLVKLLEQLAPRQDARQLPARLFSLLWVVLERRYQKRPLPKKILFLRCDMALRPWPTILALTRWIERREPALSSLVAENFGAVQRVLAEAPEFNLGGPLRAALHRLSTRRFSKGEAKAFGPRFSEAELRAFYDGLYEDLGAVEQRARKIGWAKAINGQFGIYGEDRAPSASTLDTCERYERRRASRSEVCLQITADLGNRSIDTLRNWKSLRRLPSGWLTRRRKPRKTPLRAE